MSDRGINPVVKEATYFLAHVPSLVRHGSKPSREIEKNPDLIKPMTDHLWTFEKAVAYPPNQVFIGSRDPDDLLHRIPPPWYATPLPGASRWGPFGEIMPEEEFYCMMKICDEFDLFLVEEGFLQNAISRWKEHPLFQVTDLARLQKGVSLDEIHRQVGQEKALPMHVEGNRLVGCIRSGFEEDPSLAPGIIMENLASRASGVLALRHLTAKMKTALEIDYLLGCGEEAVGDRYNRGGGNMAKAIGELCGCMKATGSDVKAFCCAPLHAMVLASSLVTSGIFKNVVVVAGGSLAKLGMKFHGHLRHDMPILEDVLAGIAIWIGEDDGVHPVIRLDSIGKQEIGSGSAQPAIIENLVVRPLDRLGLKLCQIDKYATELHNPEVTEPQGSGNVPRTNYRTIGSFAVLRKEIKREELDRFVEEHGMPGFSPTQGHIASAVPYLGHALRRIMKGEIATTMFLAKGSLFLGRMTNLSDGISFLLEKNDGGGDHGDRG